jgi:hypothetical protein
MLSAPQLVTGLSPLRFRCGALFALTRATCDAFSANFGKKSTVFSKDQGCNAVLWQSDHFTADVMQHAGLLLRMVIFIANRNNGGQRKESATNFFCFSPFPPVGRLCWLPTRMVCSVSLPQSSTRL